MKRLGWSKKLATAALVASAALTAGCVAEVGSAEQLMQEFAPGRFTYSALYRTIQIGTSGGVDLFDEASPKGPPDVAPPQPLIQAVNLQLITVSSCHAGDLDFAVVAMKAAKQPLIATLETPEGLLLASSPLGNDPLVTEEQLSLWGHENRLNKPLTVTLPPGLRQPDSMHQANLFICVDTNQDKKCANELVDNLNRVPGQQAAGRDSANFNVIYFRPLGMHVGKEAGAPLTFQALPQGSGNAADQVMDTVIKNLLPENGQAALSANLSFFASRADCGNGTPPSAQQTAPTPPPSRPTEPQQTPTPAPPPSTNQERPPSNDGYDPAMGWMKLLGGMFAASTLPNDQAGPAALGAFVQFFVERAGRGCFVHGEQITMGNGETVSVENVNRGSQLLTSTGEFARPARGVSGPETERVVVIRTVAGHRLTVTSLHPMLTVDGLKQAKDLKLTDALYDANHKPVRIASLGRAAYHGTVYNFALPGARDADHLVIANGLITGDLVLQQRLSATK